MLDREKWLALSATVLLASVAPKPACAQQQDLAQPQSIAAATDTAPNNLMAQSGQQSAGGAGVPLPSRPVNEPPPEPSPYLSSWLNQSFGVVGSARTRFGPYLNNDVYAEYEFWGRKGPFDLYGYVDLPRAFGVGNVHDTGVTNNGSPVFTEQEPRISIDHLLGRSLAVGPIKEWYMSFDWIYDLGHSRAGRQNTLYSGFGVDIDTHTKWLLSANLYVRRQWENYGAANENSWDGYRLQMKYIYPIATFYGGKLTYIGYFNYDFGSRLREKTGDNSRTNNAFVATNALNYGFKHWRFWAVARYFHNGGQWQGGELETPGGTIQVRSTGWGYYGYVGYQF
ncbi:nucleoside-specific channel-forming protein Tsx [Paraburkholderia susongensis]|nr:nucleoside-specific channel-forming protein Tsx [Paraburkholderia susongensis]